MAFAPVAEWSGVELVQGLLTDPFNLTVTSVLYSSSPFFEVLYKEVGDAPLHFILLLCVYIPIVVSLIFVVLFILRRLRYRTLALQLPDEQGHLTAADLDVRSGEEKAGGKAAVAPLYEQHSVSSIAAAADRAAAAAAVAAASNNKKAWAGDRRSLLSRLRLFELFVEDEIVEAIADVTEVFSYSPGDVLFQTKRDGAEGEETQGQQGRHVSSDGTDCLFIVLQGKVNVYLQSDGVTEPNHPHGMLLASNVDGQCVTSMLSILTQLSDRTSSTNKGGAVVQIDLPSLVAVAAAESTVAFVPLRSLAKDLLRKYPKEVTRLLRAIGLRLQRVLLNTISSHFGLAKEMFHSVSVFDILAEHQRLHQRHLHLQQLESPTNPDQDPASSSASPSSVLSSLAADGTTTMSPALSRADSSSSSPPLDSPSFRGASPSKQRTPSEEGPFGNDTGIGAPLMRPHLHHHLPAHLHKQRSSLNTSPSAIFGSDSSPQLDPLSGATSAGNGNSTGGPAVAQHAQQDLELAYNAFAVIFGVHPSTCFADSTENNEVARSCRRLLRQRVQLVDFEHGDVVMHPTTSASNRGGSMPDGSGGGGDDDDVYDPTAPALYIVLEGQLNMYCWEEDELKGMEEEEEQQEELGMSYDSGTGKADSKYDRFLISHMTRGHLAGALAVITGDFIYHVEACVNNPTDDAGTQSGVSSSTASVGPAGVTVARLSKASFDQLVSQRPSVLSRLVMGTLGLVRPLVYEIDYALDWMHTVAGKTVYQAQDPPDGIYVVLSGRLGSLASHKIDESEKNGGRKKHVSKGRVKAIKELPPLFGQGRRSRWPSNMSLVCEYGRNDTFGALEVLTGARRPTSVMALRDTELVKIPNSVFNLVIKRYPQVAIRFSRLVGHTLRRQLLDFSGGGPTSYTPLGAGSLAYRVPGASVQHTKVHTVAVIGVASDVPTAAFTRRLTMELSRIQPTLLLNSSSIRRYMTVKKPPAKAATPSDPRAASSADTDSDDDDEAFLGSRDVQLTRLLGEMEESYDVVLYECEDNLSSWTKRCIRQADCILIVGKVKGDPEIGITERYVWTHARESGARKELVLLHPSNKAAPQSTIQWLQLRRGYLTTVHHVRSFDESDPEPERTFRRPSGPERSRDGRRTERPRTRSMAWAKNLSLNLSTYLWGKKPTDAGADGAGEEAGGVRRYMPSFIRKTAVSGARTLFGSFSSRADSNLTSDSNAGDNSDHTALPNKRGKGLTGKTKNSWERDFLFNNLNPKDDVARIARRLTNTSVALVLGGGGARGLAHLGVIRALEENGIPIDLLAGTSMGAYIGAMYAREPNYLHCHTRTKQWANEMTKKWRWLVDITYPKLAFFAGREFNKMLRDSLTEHLQIEDLWLNYFNITTNISAMKMEVHRDGPLWRYVRASMTLAGFLPPMPHHQTGDLLVDGGYVNNVPADVMHALFGVKTIIAVDVGADDCETYHNYGDSVSGWWLLWQKINPFASEVNIPSLDKIQSNLAYVACAQQLESIRMQESCVYMRPPIEDYGTLDFDRFDEIVDAGYKYAMEEIGKWKAKSTTDDDGGDGEGEGDGMKRRVMSLENLTTLDEEDGHEKEEFDEDYWLK
eukprot:TRINITY_DN4671_c0_g1_i1.p1 TRINITY_DN4671_c0_g1~~TRINITY_DN4671_c0_g1_i1.p1  ORF type:complete len:1600 (+),score=389.07 TRINITY_DN4671_c0_g1_i1:371-5170(+)